MKTTAMVLALIMAISVFVAGASLQIIGEANVIKIANIHRSAIGENLIQ